ncbi:MAG: prepilin peptidase [Firmicutes bacterium]|nr:prepilin peptidase [Bacillota bacterium]
MVVTWLFFILGSVFGSFFNVVIYRIPRGQSIVAPRSHCPSCGHTLRPRELIPVLSFLIQQGKCSSCRATISWQYPVVELLTAVGFAFYAFSADSWQELVVLLVFFSLLLIASVIDLQHQILPNVITLPGMIIGLCFAALRWTIPIFHSMLGIIVGGGVLLVIAVLTKGMGMGDVKFLAFIGAFIGPLPTVIALFAASLLGTIYGIIYLTATKQGRKTPIPFGPFLALGALITIGYWF